MKPKEIFGVPIQKKGSSHDTESQKNYVAPERVDHAFNTLRERLMLINNWKSYCGEGFADFKLFDSKGEMINRYPLIRDSIRIDIPGPGTVEAKGFDWVQIVDLFEEQTHDLLIVAGGMIGVSKIEYKTLVNGLLDF